jgi:hypothetical protein
MDPEGARALAKRIADGPPREEEEAPKPQQSLPPHSDESARSSQPRSLVEIVYVKPHRVRRPDVRIYVRGPDGHLARSEP